MKRELKDVITELKEMRNDYSKILDTAKKNCNSTASPHDQWYHEKMKELASKNRVDTIDSMLSIYEDQNITAFDT